MPFRHFYLLSHYICNGLLFLFSVCWLHVNEFNSFWEELRGRGQKSTACSEDIFVMEFYLPVLTLHLQWFILFYFLCFGSRRNEYNSFLGIRIEVRSLLLARKVYHPEEKDDILPQYSSEFIVYNDSRRYHLISMTASRRQYQNKPQPSVPFPISLQRLFLFSFVFS